MSGKCICGLNFNLWNKDNSPLKLLKTVEKGEARVKLDKDKRVKPVPLQDIVNHLVSLYKKNDPKLFANIYQSPKTKTWHIPYSLLTEQEFNIFRRPFGIPFDEVDNFISPERIRSEEQRGCKQGFMVAFKKALEAWEKVINIKFYELPSGSSAPVRIKFAFCRVEKENAAGFATHGKESLVFVDVYRTRPKNLLSVIVHEIGHALGLNHPGNYNGKRPDKFTKGDHVSNTVMSYNDNYISDISTAFHINEPGVLDIIAAGSIYGFRPVNPETGRGKSYVFKKEDINVSTLKMLIEQREIIDVRHIKGGRGCKINLNSGKHSSIVGRNNIAIGPRTIIKNAIGSESSDIIIGNPHNNALNGHKGEDIFILQGPWGIDTITADKNSGAIVVLKGIKRVEAKRRIIREGPNSGDLVVEVPKYKKKIDKGKEISFCTLYFKDFVKRMKRTIFVFDDVCVVLESERFQRVFQQRMCIVQDNRKPHREVYPRKRFTLFLEMMEERYRSLNSDDYPYFDWFIASAKEFEKHLAFELKRLKHMDVGKRARAYLDYIRVLESPYDSPEPAGPGGRMSGHA